MKKILLVLLALAVLSIPLVSTSCNKILQVAFIADPSSGPAALQVTFNNTTPNGAKNTAFVYDWNFGDGQTKTGASFTDVISHEYIKVGTYTVTLTGYKTGAPDKNTTATQTVTVTHGVIDKLTVTPETVELNIGQVQAFTSSAYDAYGNPITEAGFFWKNGDAGTVGDDGKFTAGTVAGEYENGVYGVADIAGKKVQEPAAVTVLPDPLDSATLASLEIPAGESKQLTITGKDKYGNSLKGLEVTWSLTEPRAGTITTGGLFTASHRAASYKDAIAVTVKQGTVSVAATSTVKIVAGAVSQVGVAPDKINLGKGMTQQFVAAAADKYGNRIENVTYTWECNAAAGSISPAGLFTAGSSPASYKNAVTVTAGSGTDLKASATVNVENDRIIFYSDRADPEKSAKFYIMNADGTGVEDLSLGVNGLLQSRINVSSNGHRLVYTGVTTTNDITSSTTYICNTDGKWVTTLDIDDRGYEATLSPDGTKVAFQSWRTDKADIYVMNIDGSNCINLTEDDAYDDYPAWSPDGKKIAFISDKYNTSDGASRVFSINADGTGRKQLTEGSFEDILPQYSPDGTQILFQSNRSGSYVYNLFVMNADGSDLTAFTNDAFHNSSLGRWSPDGSKVVFCSNRTEDQFEIFIVNADGSNPVRLTSNDALDLSPTWLYPKTGIPVTANSVKIAETFGETDLTAQDISNMAKDSVVRIEVITASSKAYGSGFIIKSSGLILTNNHVISSTGTITKINVYVPGGNVYTGTVLARDMVHDLALVKIEAASLTPLEIGSFSSVQSGEKVVVLGYPLGNESVSVTSGLVSLIEFDDGACTTWIQTDSAINPGNSGGPLFDMSGKVIGVIAAKVFGIGIEGIGYAIAADTLDIYLDNMLKQAGMTL